MTLASASKVTHSVRRLTADQIPLRIVADLVNQMAKEAGASTLTVGALSFALRKQGRGNHAWVLFLSDGTSRAWKVSRGGRGKHGPTVVAVGRNALSRWIN